MTSPSPHTPPAPEGPLTHREPSPWWQTAVFYQIYPRSFCLADPRTRRRRLGVDEETARDKVRDGAGDLEGIRRHLDHLVWLGVDAIWLSPFFPSPMKDFGYDVSDYTDVDPLFGSLEDFDNLLAAAHERGLRVIIDWVPNHTSDQHRWFLEARQSRSAPHRNFYIWRDPDPDDPTKPPNNWKQTFGDGPAWTFDEATGQWYLHLFLAEQPDLNWWNPAVREAMLEVLGFWLERGVDGFRIDVVHGLGKDPELPDADPSLAALPYSILNDDERTHPILREIRCYVDSFEGDRVAVGEVFLLDTALVAKYYGTGDELHMAFNFQPMFCPFDASCFRKRVTEIDELLTPIDAWPTWVLSSHDRPRHRTRYGGSERRARAAAVMLLGMRGTAFLYAGEELGLEDAEVLPDQVVDPGGRDGCRAPIPWDSESQHGWALDGEAWLPFPPGASTRNVASLAADPSSILHLYRELLALRHKEPALQHGGSELIDAPDGVLAIRRSLDDRGGDAWVVINFTGEPIAWSPAPDERLSVAISSGGDGALNQAGSPYTRTLGPEEGVWLKLG